jgi:N-acetylglucosaminyldiphosphoundecaprenol N-acetyl-beta-D-mannosaminyltransferase
MLQQWTDEIIMQTDVAVADTPLDTSIVNVLGVGVSAIRMSHAVAAITHWLDEWANLPGSPTRKRYICTVNTHLVVESRRKPKLRHVLNHASLATPDGMPLVWWLRCIGKDVERVYGPDLMLAVCNALPHKRHYFYGGATHVPERLALKLQEQFPNLQVAGTHSPPFRPLTKDESEQVVAHINASQTDILWVGLGAPKQELWISDHIEALHVPVLVGVGAAFDYHSGIKRQAPRIIRHAGLEWLFRIYAEPRRLGRRYATTIPTFIVLAWLQWLGIRKFPLEM